MFLAFFHAGGEASEKNQIRGQVTVNGQKPESILYLEILREGKSLGLVATDEDGQFNIAAVQADAQLVVLPHNEKALWTEAQTFLAGYARVKASDAVPVQVSLTRENIVSRSIQLSDDSGKPVPNVRIACSAAIKFSKEGDPDVTWTRQWETSSNKEGIVNLRMIQMDSGAYELSLNAESLDGSRYIGKLKISGNESAKAKSSSIAWKAARKRLSLVVRCIWDPEYLKEPFRPEDGSSTPVRELVLNEKPSTAAAMDKEGIVSFYDLLPGKYQISFKKGIDPVYKVTQPSDVLDVPEKAKQPITHTLSLKLLASWKLQGIVRDSESGRPIPGASVRCCRNVAKSGDGGNFSLEVLPKESLIIEHPEYEQGTFPVPARDTARPAIMSIKPHPCFSGKVLTGNQKPAAFAEMKFESPDGNYEGKTDKEGAFKLRLKPGTYRLRIDVEILPEGGMVVGIWGAPKARIFDDPFVMPKHDLNQDFKVPAIAKVAVQVQWDKAVLGYEERPSTLRLLRESDKKIMKTVPIGNDAETILYAIEGKYTVLVSSTEQRGALCGEIDVAQNDETVKRIQIKKWEPVQYDSMGVPRLAAQPPRR
jgi:hypothetical protein